MKTLTIPVVIGALGLVKKGLDRYINKIPGKIDIGELQKNCASNICQSSEYYSFTIVTSGSGSGYEFGAVGRNTYQHG